MQNIHIKRYEPTQGTGFQGCIEPEDRSWVVFLDAAGRPTLWHRVEGTGSEGKVEHAYAPSDVPAAA